MRPEAFHPFARLLHWLMAVLILAMLFIGVSMVADLSPRHPVLISLHKATGQEWQARIERIHQGTGQRPDHGAHALYRANGAGCSALFRRLHGIGRQR